MNTAARPTKPLKYAMSCGRPVISTDRARQTPNMAPRAIARPMSSSVTIGPMWSPEVSRAEVTSACTMAMPTAPPMPAMPSVLPRRAVSGFDRPASAMMNRMAAAM